MSTLEAYRDDGPLVRLLTPRLAGEPRTRPRRTDWLVPPFLRVVEYGLLIALTALAAPDALPVCYALLCVLAFHQYDIVYRLRHQRRIPPPWLQAVGGGWDGRLLVAAILALAGVLGWGLLAGTIALAVVYVAESVASWIRFAQGSQPAADEGDDDEGVEDME